MRKIIAAIVLGVSVMAPAAAQGNDTTVTVGLVKEMTGARSAVVLEWGSKTYGIVLKTNGIQSKLTVRAVSTSGFGVSLADVKISFKAPDAYGISGNTISRRGKTSQYGDVIWVTVSGGFPVGSPTVYLQTTYQALDHKGVWR